MEWNSIGALQDFNLCKGVGVNDKTVLELTPTPASVLSEDDVLIIEAAKTSYEPEFVLYTLQIRQTKYLQRTGLFILMTPKLKKPSKKHLCFLRYISQSTPVPPSQTGFEKCKVPTTQALIPPPADSAA